MLACLGSSTAAPPAWWATRGATNANPPDDFAAVNQGQLKHFTQKAVQELNARIPGGAGSELNGLVNGWVQAYQTGGYNATNPLQADFDAMNSGQLKWIASKVHARLVEIKYEDAVPAWLVQNPATDHQLVNLGQLKTVFNFDLSAPHGQLPAWWQKYYFNGQTGIDPNGDDDGDWLSNLQELTFGSSPADSDTDDNGIPDYEEPALIAAGQAAAGENTYAPVIDWWGHTRALVYNYSSGNGSLFTAAYWDGSLGGSSESSVRRALGGLHGTLNSTVAFPPDKSTGPNYMYPISSFCTTSANSDFVTHHDKQVRMFASSPAATAITRQLMVLRYLDYNSDIPGSIEAYSFTIPAKGIVSPPQFFGQDYVPADRAYQFLDFYTPRFQGSTEQGWDDTGLNTWCAVNVAEATTAQLALSVPSPAWPLLEIVVPSAYAAYISLSEHALPLADGRFKITGIAPTGPAGAEIVLRLKSDPTKVFATMKVRVFEKRIVPVTIYRIYDSRNQQTEFSSGITNAQIIAGLNSTYLNQGNIHFAENGASNTYDIRYDKSQSVHVELPVTYFINGKFPESNSRTVLNLVKKGQYGHPIPARLLIIVARNIYDANTLGFTPVKNPSSVHRGCFIGSGVDLNVTPHEAGHALELADKAVGQGESHDHGLWPKSFASDPRLMRWGLMYDAVSLQTIPWLRQEDWTKSNTEALILK